MRANLFFLKSHRAGAPNPTYAIGASEYTLAQQSLRAGPSLLSCAFRCAITTSAKGLGSASSSAQRAFRAVGVAHHRGRRVDERERSPPYGYACPLCARRRSSVGSSGGRIHAPGNFVCVQGRIP
ncbi:hypothetical protein THIOKS1990002 [Thiocapsa sp. KS1]|nr:hypothetical protein THIOKS1990002 [Thiocapsa sp. KS1]